MPPKTVSLRRFQPARQLPLEIPVRGRLAGRVLRVPLSDPLLASPPGTWLAFVLWRPGLADAGAFRAGFARVEAADAAGGALTLADAPAYGDALVVHAERAHAAPGGWA